MNITAASKNIRPSSVLTGSYVVAATLGAEANDNAASDELYRPNKFNQLVLYVALTLGSLTSAQIKVEFSPDNATWYQESALTSITSSAQTVAAPPYEFTADGNYRLAIPLNDRYIRVSAKGTGTVTGSLMAIDARLGVN